MLGEIIQKALEEELDEREREAVILHKYYDMNHRGIAIEMGLTVEAVRRLLESARSKLRLKLLTFVYQ